MQGSNKQAFYDKGHNINIFAQHAPLDYDYYGSNLI